MLSKSQEKLVRSLRIKKNRIVEKLFIIEGTKLIEEAIQEGISFSILFATTTWVEKHDFSGEFTEVDEREMQKISSLKTAPGVLAIVPYLNPEIKQLGITLILDHIKDPGNLGTIIRTAETFGVTEIICSEETVDLYNEKVVQASMGSIFRVPVKYEDLETYLSKVDAKQVYASSLEGASLYEVAINFPAYLIMGSESHGIRNEIYQFAMNKIKVPQQGKVESMNVSIATAVILAEFQRRVK